MKQTTTTPAASGLPRISVQSIIKFKTDMDRLYLAECISNHQKEQNKLYGITEITDVDMIIKRLKELEEI